MKNILIFGDVVGRIGREALKKALPDFCSEYKPDLIVANCENLAHGFGINSRILGELFDAGVDVFTSGNHIWSNPGYKDVLSNPEMNHRIIRPLNDIHTEGVGYTIYENDHGRFLITNLTGCTFMKEEYPIFFEPIDQVLKDLKDEKFDATLVDFHAEATSEKNVLGRYLDGRISIFYGTHTHVPTADAKILPQGTAYISDVGMVGAHNQALGGQYEPILEGMKQGNLGKFEVPLDGPVEINAILVKVQDGQATSIKQIQKIIQM